MVTAVTYERCSFTYLTFTKKIFLLGGWSVMGDVSIVRLVCNGFFGSVASFLEKKVVLHMFFFQAELRRSIGLLQAEVQKKDGTLAVHRELHLAYILWCDMTNGEGSDRLTVKRAYCSWKASLHTALFCFGSVLMYWWEFIYRFDFWTAVNTDGRWWSNDGHPTSLAFLLFWLTNYYIYIFYDKSFVIYITNKPCCWCCSQGKTTKQ